MNPLLARRLAGAVAVTVSLVVGAMATTAPEQVAELVLHGLPPHPKWNPGEPPLLGTYLGSGDGEAFGKINGRVYWDLYEDQSREDRHPTYFRGQIERDGRHYPFEIIGIYSPASADKKRWRFSGAITFADKAVLGTEQQPIVGRWEASTRTSHFMVWPDFGAQ
jgi:hypothetical protein